MEFYHYLWFLFSIAAAPGALSAAERSYPTSEVRGRSQEDPMPKGSGQEELPHVRGQGQWLRVPSYDSAGTAERSYPGSEVRGGSREELPHAPRPEVRGGGREEQPHAQGQRGRPEGATHVQGAVAARAQEGLEELSHVEG